MTGTDLEVELIGRVEVSSAESGEVTVPARKMVDICRELPDKADIEFALVDNRLEIDPVVSEVRTRPYQLSTFLLLIRVTQICRQRLTASR